MLAEPRQGSQRKRGIQLQLFSVDDLVAALHAFTYTAQLLVLLMQSYDVRLYTECWSKMNKDVDTAFKIIKSSVHQSLAPATQYYSWQCVHETPVSQLLLSKLNSTLMPVLGNKWTH